MYRVLFLILDNYNAVWQCKSIGAVCLFSPRCFSGRSSKLLFKKKFFVTIGVWGCNPCSTNLNNLDNCYIQLDSADLVTLLEKTVQDSIRQCDTVSSPAWVWKTALIKRCVSILPVSSKYYTHSAFSQHLETDNQGKITNQEIKRYFCNYVNHFQDDWVERLLIAKFASNANTSAITKIFPFLVSCDYISVRILTWTDWMWLVD